jgi:hypothetical protein
MAEDKDKVRRIQELRRSSAASPVDRTESRSVIRRKAIQEQLEHLCGACHKPVLYNQKFDQYACSDPECINAHGFGICGYYGCQGRFDDITDEHRKHHPTPEEINAAPRRSARMLNVEYNEDGTCKSTCAYGTCGGGYDPCGGCCGCLGGCEMGREEALLASDEALRRTDPEPEDPRDPTTGKRMEW